MVLSGIFLSPQRNNSCLMHKVRYMKPTGYKSGLTTFLTPESAFIAGTESPLNHKSYLSKTLTCATNALCFGVPYINLCLQHVSVEVTCGEIYVLSERGTHLFMCIVCATSVVTVGYEYAVSLRKGSNINARYTSK